MTLRLLRYSFVVVLTVATLATFANAGVLQLAPVSEVGNSKDGAAWVSEDGAADECFSDNGAVFSEETADVAEADDRASEDAMVCVSLPPEPAAMNAATTPNNQPGDVNCDGYVNDADIDIIASNWQYGVTGTVVATREMGDLNADGKVDGSDVTIVADNWGATPIPVPEPSTIMLLLSGIVGLVLARRYRKA